MDINFDKMKYDTEFDYCNITLYYRKKITLFSENNTAEVLKSLTFSSTEKNYKLFKISLFLLYYCDIMIIRCHN